MLGSNPLRNKLAVVYTSTIRGLLRCHPYKNALLQNMFGSWSLTKLPACALPLGGAHFFIP